MKIFLLCLLVPVVVIASEKVKPTEVFTWHPKGNPVTLYKNADLTQKRIDIFPDADENMVGCIIAIDKNIQQGLRVNLEPMGFFFIEPGTVAVNTRNYSNNSFFLYERPEMDAPIVMQSKSQQTVIVFNVDNNWLYVEAINDDGVKRKGWLPPDMQCANPYTTCN